MNTRMKIRFPAEAVMTSMLFVLLGGLAFVHDPGALDSGKAPRLLVLLLLLAAATGVAAFRPVREKLAWSALRCPVVLAWAAYTLSVWLSLAFAWNVSAGLLDACRTSAVFLVLTLLAAGFRSLADWQAALAKAGVLAGLALGTVGVYQVVSVSGGSFPGRTEMELVKGYMENVDPKEVLHGHAPLAIELVKGFMGNVNLFASYLLFLFPIGVLGCAILRGAWRWAAALSTLLSGGLLLVLQCRSAWLGVIACILVFLAVALVRPRALALPAWSRLATIGFLALAAALPPLFLAFAPPENPLAKRAHDVFSSDIRFSDGGRVMVWKGTMKMIADHFPFGAGAGNFPLRLHGTRAGAEVDFYRVVREWNQPHNDFLWVFAEKGVAGLLAFLAIFVLGIRAGIQTISRTPHPRSAWTATAALAGLAAYAVDSLFSFPLDRVNHQVALAVVLATLSASGRDAAETPLTPAPDGTFSRVLFNIWVAVALPILAVGILVSSVSWLQERQVALARKAFEKKNWTAMLLHARRAATPLRTLDTYMVPVSFLEGFALMNTGRTASAIERMEQAQRENPDRHYILDNLASLRLARGEFQEADALYRRTIALYPERIESRHNLAVCLIRQGAHAEAVAVLLEIPEERRTGLIQATLARALRKKAIKPPEPSGKTSSPQASQGNSPATVP